MYTNFLFSLIFLVCNLSSYAQNVSIHGVVAENIDSSNIWFCRSIDSSSCNYAFMYDRSSVIDGIFNKSYSCNNENFVTIVPTKYSPKIYLIFGPGDSLDIKIKKKTDNLFDVSFRGDNAKGQELLYSSTFFNNSKDEILIDSLLLISKSANEGIRHFENIKKYFFKQIDSLYDNNDISKDFSALLKSYGEAKLRNALYRKIFDHSERGDFTTPLFTLKLIDCDTILNYTFTTYDPFSDKYSAIDGVERTISAQFKCDLIERGIIKGRSQDYGFWSDSITLKYNYAPIDLQQRIFVIDLMFSRKYEINSKKLDSINFEKFKRLFPTNPYNNYLSSFFTKETSDAQVFPFTSLKYTNNPVKIKYFPVRQYTDLRQLIDSNFKGRAVFVDLWATWCGPCKDQFRYSRELSAFLTDHKIELVYISLDFPAAGKLWINNITEFDLIGYHYFATDSFSNSLQKDLKMNVIALPKYLLFDLKGTMIDSNLPEPSTKVILYKRIIELLNNY